MRVLAFVWHYSSPRNILSGGGTKRFVEIASRAPENNIKLTTIENAPSLCSLNHRLRYYPAEFHVPLSKYEDLILFRLLTWMYTAVKMAYKGASLCRKRQFDLTMTPDGELFCMAFPTYFVHLVTKTPLLLVVQQVPSGIPSEGITREYKRYRASGFGKITALSISIYAYITRNLLVKIYNKVPLIIAVSKSLEDQLKDYGVKTKIQVIGNGIDLKSIDAVTYKGDKKYDAIFVGRHSPEKGIFDLINAWKIVARQLPHVILILAGYSTKEVLNSINKKIEEYGLKKNVIVRGVVSEEEKILLLKQTKLFIYLSRYEAAPLTPAEAIACGLPVICYDMPFMRELYSCDAVIRCKIGDVYAISQKVVELILNESVRKNLMKAGRKFVLKFDWETITTNEFHIYSFVSKESSRHMRS